MKKQRIKRFLKRNCIKIPFYAAALGLVVMASGMERQLQQPTEFKVPVTVQEVWAAEEPAEEPTVQEMIEAACEEYGIDHQLLLAIAKLETGHFTSAAYTEGNNVGGMSIDEVPMTFESLPEGVDAYVKNLTENYFEIGLDTPEEIGRKYCPVNPQWAETVRGLM